MSDSVIDLVAERRSRAAAGGAVTVTATVAGVQILVGSETESTAAWLDLEAAERHVATMQRAIAAVRAARPKSGHLTTAEPRQ